MTPANSKTGRFSRSRRPASSWKPAKRSTSTRFHAYSESIADLRQAVSGALVYIGNTAQAEGDFAHTARSPEFPGLFANARLADQLMRHIYITEAPLWLEILLIVALPLAIAYSFSVLRTSLAIAIALLSTLVYAYVNEALFVLRLYWLDLVHVVIAMIAATLFVGLFTVGMGINTGDVVMGNLGARSRMNYTVIGDNVNLAARLYNVAKPARSSSATTRIKKSRTSSWPTSSNR